jgi:hypothetical protein
MKEVQEALNFAANISPDQWTAIGTAIATSGILSPLLMAVKKIFDVQREWVMFGIVVAACFGVASIAYIKDAITINPVLATTLLTVTTNAVYYAVYKPLKKKVLPKAVETWVEASLYKKQRAAKKLAEDVPGRVQ